MSAANELPSAPPVWLAICFKITTRYTGVFLPRTLVYMRYVWALSSYIYDRLDRVYTHF